MFKIAVLDRFQQNSELLKSRFEKFQEFQKKRKFIEKVKEEKYQDGFFKDIFENTLGYTLESSNPENANLFPEEKNETDSKKADGVIKVSNSVIGIVELKDFKTKNLSLVEDQAFNYHNSHSNSKYIIISNFSELRFYIDKKTEFESFKLFEMNFEEFKQFHAILSFESISENLPMKFREETTNFEREISEKFYKDFSEVRLELYEEILKQVQHKSPEQTEFISVSGKLEALNLSQKILDRIVFIFFGESRGLLKFSKNYILETWKSDISENPLWEILKIIFRKIDVGGKIPKTYAYNGGLFAKDEKLDSLNLSDEILKKALNLGSYDFSTELDVNILGHIFENSLDDLQKFAENDFKSIRKRDGVFYTPQFITKYIIENTIGELCRKKWAEIVKNETESELLEYRKFLENLRILDPAVGSGAFLNEALDFLAKEHEKLLDKLLPFGDLTLGYEFDKEILENNLFGVDINRSAIEVAKLSLWIKTAKPNRKLSNLNKNLKVANSLLEMPFAEKSFDIVIGNPPYGAKLEKEKKAFPIQSNESAILFMQLSRRMLKPKSFHGFIIPKPFIYSSSWAKIRDVLEHEIFKIVDCGKVWKEVKLEQVIYISQLDGNFESYKNYVLEKEKFVEVGENRKDLIGKFGFYLNGVSKSEIDIALKMLKQKKNLFEISTESNRGGMFQKHVSQNGSLAVLGGKNIGRYETKNIKGFISNDLEITENSFLRENSVLLQEIVAHIQNPKDHIKIIGTLIDDIQNYVLIDTIQQVTLNSNFSNRFILALLHSTLINWFVYRFIFAKAIRTMHLSNQVLKKLPIPEISQKQQKPIIDFVDEVISLKSKISKFKKHFDKLSAVEKIEISEEIEKAENRISELENQIDKIVFKLYDLSDEEIGIVKN